MITEDYNKGPRVVRKDYVLRKIQIMQESASMPASSGQAQFSIRSLVALKLKLKNYVCGQSTIAYNIIIWILKMIFFCLAVFTNYIINLKH